MLKLTTEHLVHNAKLLSMCYLQNPTPLRLQRSPLSAYDIPIWPKQISARLRTLAMRFSLHVTRDRG